MGTTRARGKRAVAADAWRLMAGFASDKFLSGDRRQLLRDLGLTPGHLKALAVLDPDEPRPMRAMADALACDASMVTWLADRLEERGLVERRSLPGDRRVRTLTLTPRGIQVRKRLTEAMLQPPEELLELDAESLEALRDALSKLPQPSRPFWSQAGSQRPSGPSPSAGQPP